MDFDSYQETAMGFMTETVREDQISYGLLNLAAETGEVCDKFAKALRKGGDVNDTEVLSELGDVLWCIACLAEGMGYSLEDVAELNINKLTDRQARGQIVGIGDNR